MPSKRAAMSRENMSAALDYAARLNLAIEIDYEHYKHLLTNIPPEIVPALVHMLSCLSRRQNEVPTHD